MGTLVMAKSFGPLSLVSAPTGLHLPALIGEGTAALRGAWDPKTMLHPFLGVLDPFRGGLAFCLRSMRWRQVEAGRSESQAASLAPR